MKKLLTILLSLAFVLCIAGCKPETVTPVVPGPPGTVDGDTPFTVTLTCGNKPFIPETDMTALWSDGNSLYEAEFDSEGKASATGLDGDYNVTLKGIPDGYTYNPNIYVADNENKDIEIEIYPLIPVYGSGRDLYTNVIEITELGVYRLKFTQAGQQLYCQYKPNESGTYAIESIMDINANEINPRIDIYIGTRAWKPEKPNRSLNDGGATSVYTKNFKYEVYITKSELSNVYAFAVKFDSRVGVSEENPVYIDFMITRDGDFERDGDNAEIVMPTSIFDSNGNVIKAQEFPFLEYDFEYIGIVNGGRTKLDGSNIAYSDPKNGGDGYYHMLDADGKMTDTLLYMAFNNRLVDFLNNEYVSLVFGGKNYLYFIRGFAHSLDIGLLGYYGNNPEKIPADALAQIEAMNYQTYATCLNSDGAYPVTKELKDFLQAFSVKESYFSDGNGWAEADNENGGPYDSSYEDQWLFACGYYKKS